MNNSQLKSLNNKSLLVTTETLVREERKITTEVLQCLCEVESRMLFAELGYSSLHEFCIKHLHYSEGSAHRRISSMRLLKLLPEVVQCAVENKINEGTLTITSLSSLQSFLKIEKKESGKIYSAEEKVDLIKELENKSKRDVEKKLAAIQPKLIPQESSRVITSTLTEIKFIADESLVQKLERVREVSAHVMSSAGMAEMVSRLADEYLKKHDPMLKEAKTTLGKSQMLNASITDSTSPELELRVSKTAKVSQGNKASSASRHIPADIRRKVWLRDGGKCTFVSCNSKFGLEIDHREPFALGGTHELKNLRLLCRNHNQLQAKRHFK